MNWYLAKIIFSITTGNGRHTPQFDIQLRMIAAENQEKALQLARKIGLKEDEIFLSGSGEMVRWQFIDVAELNPLPAFESGMILDSRTEEPEEADAYIHFIRSKAALLEKQHDITFAAN